MTKYSDNLTNADVQAVLLALPDHAITGDEMCPCQNRRHAPDAVARLVKAARAGWSNTVKGKCALHLPPFSPGLAAGPAPLKGSL